MVDCIKADRSGQSLNAWCPYPYVEHPNAAQGLLKNLTMAVKDIYPVEGYPNGWGQPTRLAEVEIDRVTHAEVQKLLDAGAVCLGKSQCEELCFSLMGSNKHYGQPVNSKAPERLTGGSSSGSASLVAGGAVDIATASDTAGSIRAPASFCGLIGLRPTHGLLSLERAMPLAPSFDCFGWYAKDIETYALVTDVLLEQSNGLSLSRLLEMPSLEDLLFGPEEKAAFHQGSEFIKKQFEHVTTVDPFSFTLEEAAQVFSIHQSYEAWRALGPWVTSRQPDLDFSIRRRFQDGSSVSDNDFEWSVGRRNAITDEIESLLGTDGVLLLPTVPSCAPLKSSKADKLQIFRMQMLQLLCLSGLSALPQITLPLAEVHGAPFGVSLMGPKCSDRALLSLSEAIMGSFGQTS